ncbi:hypothetical protein H0H93_014330 [Arthromyces matolae]|nr:hypothetical protein H0H93_014330 [Arthromyces matolae]
MDQTAMWLAIGPPKFIHPLQVASNVAANLSRIRQRLLTEAYYLGKPDVHIPTARRWVGLPCGQVLVDSSQTIHEPITFVAVLHITSDAFSLSSSSLMADSSQPTVLSGRATSPCHAVFRDDFFHVLGHLQELAVDEEDFFPDLALLCSRSHLVPGNPRRQFLAS